MPQSFLTRHKLIVESTPDAGTPAQIVATTDEPLGPYKACIQSLRQSYMTSRFCVEKARRKLVGNTKIKNIFCLRNRFFSPGPYGLAIKTTHCFWRFLRAFSIPNLDVQSQGLYRSTLILYPEGQLMISTTDHNVIISSLL